MVTVVLLVLSGWTAAAVPVAVVLGLAIRRADQQAGVDVPDHLPAEWAGVLR